MASVGYSYIPQSMKLESQETKCSWLYHSWWNVDDISCFELSVWRSFITLRRTPNLYKWNSEVNVSFSQCIQHSFTSFTYRGLTWLNSVKRNPTLWNKTGCWELCWNGNMSISMSISWFIANFWRTARSLIANGYIAGFQKPLKLSSSMETCLPKLSNAGFGLLDLIAMTSDRTQCLFNILKEFLTPLLASQITAYNYTSALLLYSVWTSVA